MSLPTLESDTELAPEQSAIVSWTNGVTHARVLQSTSTVLLLEGEPPVATPGIGTPVQVSMPGTSRMLPGRLAAFGPDGRFVLALGKRPVRGALRVRVDLPAQIWCGTRRCQARIVDLSSSGARLRGVALGVGSECQISFVPPGRTERATMRCVVVRTIDETDSAVAFCGGALSFRIELIQA